MPYTPELSAEPTVAEFRTALHGAGDYLRGLTLTSPDERGDSHTDDVRSAVDFINEADAIVQAYERSAPPAAQGPEAAFTELRQGHPTVGEQFTDSDAYTDGIGNFAARHVEHEVRGSLASRENRTLLGGGSLTVTIGDDGGAWRPLGTPIAPVPRQQRLFIRDVLNVIPTTLGAVPYIQELNPATNETGATAVAEGVAKPEVTMEFTPKLAPVVKIAAWIPVTTEILEDAPTLQGYINTRLSYMLALREEAEILNGGGGVNIDGILLDSNIQTQNVVSSDFPGTIGLAIGKIENKDGEATFVASNPLDFWVAATTRHANAFDNGYTPGAPAVLAGLTWGTEAIRSRSLTSGTALVGAAMGATIADRMQTAIRVGNQHSTYFTENKVAVLAEERLALLLHRPDLFVKATVPTS